MTVTVKKDILKDVLKKVELFSKVELLIGIPGTSEIRKGKEPNEITNSYLGYINEFGSPAKNIPPRPFLNPGVKKVRSEIINILKKSSSNVLSGSEDVEKGLNRAGIVAVSSVKNIIRTQENFKALSEKTIKERKQKGFLGEKALIRTAQLLNSITYVIREK